MARHHNRDWVAAVRCANRTHRIRPAELLRDLAVASCFAKRNRQQCLPDTALKWRASHVQRNRKVLPLAFKIFFQLPLRFGQNWPAIIVHRVAETVPMEVLILPKNGYKAVFTSDEFQFPHWGFHEFVNKVHTEFLSAY